MLVTMLPAGAAVAAPSAAAASAAAVVARAPATIHVARSGRDAASGSSAAPLRSIQAAVSRSSAGDRIVVHGGTYHEEIEIPANKRVSLSSAPGSRVWLDGARTVTGWREDDGGRYVHDGWRVEFDSSPTYHWGAPDNEEEHWSFINKSHPMAAHPDQVWVGGKELRQVSSLSRVRAGTFFVDDSADRLYLGTNPAGKRVRASAIAKAISIRGAGSSVTGIGVRRFAPSVPHMGAVTIEAPDVTLADMRIVGNATTGLHVSARNATLTKLTLTRNGMLGAGATYADGIRMTGLRVSLNNTERFNHSPVAGGLKIGRTRGIVVRNSTFNRNAGTGLWFDESSYGVLIANSSMRRNMNHGLSLEISARAVVVDNVIAGNADNGIKVNGTSNVSLWNNTIVGNGRPVNIVQDGRDPTDSDTPGRDPRQPRPDPTMTWVNGPVEVHNNILTASKAGNCLLCVEDYSERFSGEEMRVRSSGNVYQRRNSSSPSWAVVWSRGPGNPAVFTTVREFRAATGRERRHLDLVGVAAVQKSLRATKRVVSRTGAVAAGLPDDIARTLGRRPGARHLGAWFG
ncbi:right-handed parallel beta-helix repeat-containing protein [Nocardioides sp.]|uniref:right-handed parallel beta-helix repeat-containing protein n=1 Tax=Nocardioides sp. TaxID=35761 RepID=UPI0027335717|nr:right-handed parallel beta-helix repeat-containing protein [Nocardioides sp.]MDP3894952.1 right-handed parallel beta-helix repeat-containing protein [Nocardioides sp.]